MNDRIVHYTLKPGNVEENEALVSEVYRELHASSPEGLRYATFVLDDGITFVHVAVVESVDGGRALQANAAFREFQKGIGSRCDAQPVVSAARVIGSYRFGAGHEE